MYRNSSCVVKKKALPMYAHIRNFIINNTLYFRMYMHTVVLDYDIFSLTDTHTHTSTHSLHDTSIHSLHANPCQNNLTRADRAGPSPSVHALCLWQKPSKATVVTSG